MLLLDTAAAVSYSQSLSMKGPGQLGELRVAFENHYPVTCSVQWCTQDSAGGAQSACPQPPTNFSRFSHKITLILAQFFIEKMRAMSAVTTDKAKIFLRLD